MTFSTVATYVGLMRAAVAALPVLGLRIVVAATLVTGAVLWAAPASFACSGGPSAVNVYTECLQTGGGSKPTSSRQATGTDKGETVVTPIVSSQTAKALKHAGKDSGALFALVHHFAPTHLFQKSNSQPARATGLLSSAFDLGAGPTALLIVLAGTPLLLLGGSGLHKWRNQTHSSPA